MFQVTITPRFGELDVLGHINNIALACWFELARNPLFHIFHPTMPITPRTWPLIMAHSDYDFLEPLQFPQEVMIRTFVDKIGAKSFTLYHEAWQEGRLCTTGRVVLVYYNFNARKSEPIPEDIKRRLQEHVKE